MKKKIAIIDPSSYALPYDFFYIESLSRNYSIDFFCSSTRYNAEYICKIKKLRNVNVKVYDVSGVGKIYGLYQLMKMYFYIYLSRCEYKYINFQWTIFPFFDIFLFVVLRKKLVFTFHNVKPHSSNKKYSLYFFLLSKISAKNLFVSKYTKSVFEKGNPFKGVRYYILPHGFMPLDVEVDCNAKNDTSSNYANKTRLIFWGNVKDYKGIEFLANSVNALRHNKIELEIYGKYDEDQIKYHNFFNGNGIISKDKFMDMNEVFGLITDPSALLVLPYKSASQSGVMYTYLAHKVPFISTNTGEAARFLTEIGLESMLFKYGDVESLLNSIKFFQSNKEMVLAILAKAKSNYDWCYEDVELEEVFG